MTFMQKLEPGVFQKSDYVLIAGAGFEDRAPRAAELIANTGSNPGVVVILCYPQADVGHEKSYGRLKAACSSMVADEHYHELPIDDAVALISLLDRLPEQHVVCDVTGLSRTAIFSTLTAALKLGRSIDILYTEAEEYYPTESAFSSITRKDLGEAFFRLVQYENAEVMYSADSSVNEIQGFEGHHLPNYPLMLIAFLTFKRSRLAAILREYEANSTVLIKAVPRRLDIKWRAAAVDIINFDLIESFKGSVIELETLDWHRTYEFLQGIYSGNHVKYRFNVVLAPLGSKMQTVGAWAFSVINKDVRVVTSTPSRHFHEKYSSGWRDTFYVDNLNTVLCSRDLI